jgi:hypothetical protein
VKSAALHPDFQNFGGIGMTATYIAAVGTAIVFTYSKVIATN